MQKSSLKALVLGAIIPVTTTPALAGEPGAAFIPFPVEYPVISGDGSTAVGEYNVSGPLWNKPVRWRLGTGIEELRHIDNTATQVSVSGVSQDGSVAVGRALQLTGGWAGARWVETTSSHLMLDLPGGAIDHRPAGANADGSVVVGQGKNSNDNWEATRWTQATGTVGMGHLSGYTYSAANAISADGGTIVGTLSGTFSTRAFKWTEADGMMSLGAPSEYANGVNSDGSVIVGQTTSSDAFVWSASTGLQSLPNPWGNPNSSSQAIDISDTGLIVGSGTSTTSPGGGHALVWSPDGQCRLFADMLAQDYEFVMEGFTYLRLTSVSDDGRVFAGLGRYGDEVATGFIVIIPAPSTVPALAVAVWAGAARRRRGA